MALKYVLVGNPLSSESQKALVEDKSFPFAIECKNYRVIKPIFSSLYSKDCELWDWMKQSKESAGDKIPLVVFRLYHGKDIIVISSPSFGRLSELFGSYKKKFFAIKSYEESMIKETLYLFLLEDFLEWIDWCVFRAVGASKYIRSLVPKESKE